LHVVGDAMLEQVLSQMEALAPAAQWRPLRVRIEHANGLAGARLSRAAALGLVVAQPRPTSPIASWIKAGIPVAYGSDSGFPPFAAFAQMVDPTNPNGVDRDTALAILTSGGAFAEFAEGDRGILDVGMQADLAVLSQDIMTVPGAALPATRSLMTIVAGQVAFEAPGFSSDP
ncbi:MAG TPA: amidohydrolase family protein, partial [Brevundimonas sp.]